VTGRPIPILMYHNIATAPASARLPELYVTPERFARQMEWLRRLGIQGLSMSEAMPHLRGERTSRVAVLTFDDGYADNLESALPVLKQHGFGATCYVPSGAIGAHNQWDADKLRVRKPVMSMEQLRAWSAAGLEVGAHTRSHPRLPDCTTEQIRDEVIGSRTELEERLGLEITQFCYPYGEYDARTLAAVREAGFTAATTLRRGRARPADDPLQLRRVSVRGTEGMHLFLLKVTTPYEDRRGRHHHPVPEPSLLPAAQEGSSRSRPSA
jgi:peptidoglycan/xylan/chitin deacetylase (PgdA/CDA1 family)